MRNMDAEFAHVGGAVHERECLLQSAKDAVGDGSLSLSHLRWFPSRPRYKKCCHGPRLRATQFVSAQYFKFWEKPLLQAQVRAPPGWPAVAGHDNPLRCQRIAPPPPLPRSHVRTFPFSRLGRGTSVPPRHSPSCGDG